MDDCVQVATPAGARFQSAVTDAVAEVSIFAKAGAVGCAVGQIRASKGLSFS